MVVRGYDPSLAS